MTTAYSNLNYYLRSYQPTLKYFTLYHHVTIYEFILL